MLIDQGLSAEEEIRKFLILILNFLLVKRIDGRQKSAAPDDKYKLPLSWVYIYQFTISLAAAHLKPTRSNKSELSTLVYNWLKLTRFG